MVKPTWWFARECQLNPDWSSIGLFALLNLFAYHHPTDHEDRAFQLNNNNKINNKRESPQGDHWGMSCRQGLCLRCS